MDNAGVPVPVATMIMENKTTDYEFNETQVDGRSRVLIYHPLGSKVTIVIHRLLGDRTGQVHFRANQVAFIEYSESETNVTEAPVSYIIDDQAEVIFPTEVHFQGVNTSLSGLISGVHHFYVEDKATVTVSSTAQTSQYENETHIDLSEPGHFRLPTINIRKDGILEFRKIVSNLTIGAAFLELKYKGTILMNHGYIEAGDVDMETFSVFKLEGKGHPAQEGLGAGSQLNGGSYGGVGGGANESFSYGSVFDPFDIGSGGGGQTGGSGGGFIKFNVGKWTHVDGIVDVYGADATENGGGGSGGTIFIKAYNISGLGILDASGGDGSGSGFGGSGGRIAVHIESNNLFGGQYLAHGGISGNSNEQNAGGPGTIYKYESNRGPTYRELKYNPRLNKTLIEPEHRKLTVENGALKTNNPALILDGKSLYYEFEEVQVEGYSHVHFYHPDITNIVKIVIHELTGNRKGLVRVKKHQQLQINFVEATHTYLEAPCGFHIDPKGEVILPQTIIMVTEKTVLGGGLVGVENLVVERNSEFILQEEATTALATGFKLGIMQTLQSVPGSIVIPKLYINNLGQLTVNLNPLHPTISAGKMHVRKGGKVNSETWHALFEVSKLEIEPDGVIDGSTHGYSGSKGPGAGKASTYDASGAGFAGKGNTFTYMCS